MDFASATGYEQWPSHMHGISLKALAAFALDCPQATQCLKACQCKNRLTGIEVLASIYHQTTEVSLPLSSTHDLGSFLRFSPIRARLTQRRPSFVAITASSWECCALQTGKRRSLSCECWKAQPGTSNYVRS